MRKGQRLAALFGASALVARETQGCAWRQIPDLVSGG